MQESIAIQINGLSKRYDQNSPFALNKLTLTVNKGEVFGFLGPNGAGKSKAIRTLLNFIQPTEGSATILGKDIISESIEIRKSIGYLSGDFSAYSKMTGEDFLAFMSDLQPLKNKRRIKELADTFNVNLKKKISSLSKGNRQKIGIIQAFMHEPEIYILDEPTDGLDPLMQEEFYKLVRHLKNNGSTFFVSSHNLNEVRKVCDRVAIIKDGKLVSQSKISDLALEASQTFDIIFENKPPLSELRKIPKSKIKHNNDNSVTVHMNGELSPLFKILAKEKVRHLSTRELDLDEEFMKYYSGASK